jgi:hypothetical protein
MKPTTPQPTDGAIAQAFRELKAQKEISAGGAVIWMTIRAERIDAERPAQLGGGVDLPPVERDEGMQRDYIPLPGGWEVQTKGTGSTFRLQGPKEGDHMPVTCRYLQEMLTRMAYDVRKAWDALGKGGA